MTDSYGVAEEAGGPAEVAGARVSDVVITADGMLGRHGYWASCGAAHDAVSAVGLVGHAGVSPWTHDIGARLCTRQKEGISAAEGLRAKELSLQGARTGELTFALSVVHDLKVRVSHTARHKQGTLILI